MKETDYRRAHNLGGGAVGGVGLGDEFVLVDVTTSPAKGAAAGSPSSDTSSASASASARTCADQGVAYRVTGTAEEKIKGLVGHQLEIQGRFKNAADASATASANRLPAEVEIVSFREASATAAVNEPTAPARPAPAPPSTVETPRAQAPASAPAPAASTDQPDRRELPRTASTRGLVVMIGLLALSSAFALALLRRRVI